MCDDLSALNAQRGKGIDHPARRFFAAGLLRHGEPVLDGRVRFDIDEAGSRRRCTPTLKSDVFAVDFSNLQNALLRQSDLELLIAYLQIGGGKGSRRPGRRDGNGLISAVSAGRPPRDVSIDSVVGGIDVVEAIADGEAYDVIVVGGGAAGLAAGVGAAAVALRTLIIEAGTTVAPADARSGTDLSDMGKPGLAQLQASRVRLLVGSEVVGMVPSRQGHRLRTARGQNVLAHALIVATGSEYRRLAVPNADRFENQGIHYAATGMEAALCVGEDVMIVGDGEDAGQAAVFLGGIARHVHILLRGEGPLAGLSSYLADRIQGSPNISLHTFSEIVDLGGEVDLETVTSRDAAGVEQTRNIRNLFVMASKIPNTAWLCGQLELDPGGYVRTDLGDLGAGCRFDTSCAGVFAIGDVRSGSVKHAAAAVEEGSAVVADIQRYVGALERDDG